MSNCKNNNIVMQDWTGKILFKGNYKSKAIDEVLDANRCPSVLCKNPPSNDFHCDKCNDTGYEGDFEVCWENKSDERNVYEFINY